MRQTQRQCYQRGWENEVTTRVGLISNLDVMWFPWILGMSIYLSKSHHTGFSSLCRFFHRSISLENHFQTSNDISHATHLVYGNKIVVGYERDETITQEMVVMMCAEAVRRLISKSQKNSKSQF
jgi:hypothetical protein